MSIELVEIAVIDRQHHVRLAGRVTGRVRAVLSESQDGRQQLHELAIPVWADTTTGDSASDIDMALMLKAADIIARLKLSLAG